MGVLKRNIGLSFDEDSWLLRVWAPEARTVQLNLADRNIIIDLVPGEYGYWETRTDAVCDQDRYWLILDGKQLPDPVSLSQPEGVHGASQAIHLSTSQAQTSWQNIPLKDYIFYELHTGTFSPDGDFTGIEERLDYLVYLGITAIEIMPVASFAGERNWGYDGVFPFAVQHNYGGPQGLQRLVSACHNKGLAVVLDVVYNHLGPEGNYLAEFGPYFTDKYRTPWGNALNFDDRNAQGVREYFIENALMWFRDFHIDALRLDAVHAIKDYSAVHLLQEIKKRTDLLSAHTGKNYYLIAECDLNDPRYISSLEQNGLGMSAQWVDEFHHALRVAAGEPKQGYYSDFNGIQHLGKSFRDAYVYTGGYSKERQNFFGRSAEGHPGEQFVVFSQNHDQVGNRMLGERTGKLLSFEMQKLMAAAVICSPFLPMLFMGEEWGETSPFLYFIDHTDPELVEMVRKGRKDEFAAMHAQGEAPDPKDISTFQQSKLNWKLMAAQRHATQLQFYKMLIALRKANAVLHSRDKDHIEVHAYEDQHCLVIQRGCEGTEMKLLFLLNFSGQAQKVPLPQVSASCNKLIDSADPIWLGPSASEQNLLLLAIGMTHLTIPPESFLAYSIS